MPPDLEPLFCRCDACRAKRINAQSNRRAPRNRVLHEFHLTAIVGEKKRTGSFKALLSLNLLVCFCVELGAGNAIRPEYPDDVRARLLS